VKREKRRGKREEGRGRGSRDEGRGKITSERSGSTAKCQTKKNHPSVRPIVIKRKKKEKHIF
jgi:hypothetical protein